MRSRAERGRKMKDGFEFYFILFFVALLWMDGRARREREREKKRRGEN